MFAKKGFVGILIITFLLISAVGVAYSVMMMEHGNMIGCPLMGHDAAMCPMNLFEHLSMWQSMFAAIPVQSIVLMLLSLLALFFSVRLRELLWLLHPSPQPVRIFCDHEAGTHDPLRLFTARGLMHPKIF